MDSGEHHGRNPLELDPLFSYPLPVPEPPAYRELDIGPDASPQEVTDAKSELLRRLHKERSELERSLSQVYAAVPGLKDLYPPDGTAEAGGPDVQDGQARAELEAQATRVEPGFVAKWKRYNALEQDIRRINQQALEKPENRSAFNRSHPPLGLLQLEQCATDDFVRGPNGLQMVRKDIARFLSERGEPVFHPSDLTRDDFRSDFAPNPILDGEDDGRR